VVTTNKSAELHSKYGQITFFVNKLANKVVIRQAVEKIWDVKVEAVRVINAPSKTRTFARKEYQMAGRKKAIITLKSGYKIDVPGMYENAVGQEVSNAPVTEEGS
jgi:large subunit ribosomal protein L23